MKLPTLFISHGAPTFALEPGQLGAELTRLGKDLPTPQAILVFSPHWMTSGLAVGTNPRPQTIHDFGGFPRALYSLQYEAPGCPEMAERAMTLLKGQGLEPKADGEMGLDHGTWVPLMHLYPQAQIPVFQVSMPSRLDQNGAWALGQALAPLRDEGVLLVGSGSLTHNLYEVRFNDEKSDVYAREFSAWVEDAVARGDGEAVRDTILKAPHARRAHPTPEHLWPLMFAAGAAQVNGKIQGQKIPGGILHGVLSMDSYCFN
jgi:4,5-DOPA dioxygenase extradiol